MLQYYSDAKVCKNDKNYAPALLRRLAERYVYVTLPQNVQGFFSPFLPIFCRDRFANVMGTLYFDLTPVPFISYFVVEIIRYKSRILCRQTFRNYGQHIAISFLMFFFLSPPPLPNSVAQIAHCKCVQGESMRPIPPMLVDIYISINSHARDW